MEITVTAATIRAIAANASIAPEQLRVHRRGDIPLDAHPGRGTFVLTGDISVFAAFLLAASEYFVASSDFPGVDTIVEVHEVFGMPRETRNTSGTSYRWPNVTVEG